MCHHVEQRTEDLRALKFKLGVQLRQSFVLGQGLCFRDEAAALQIGTRDNVGDSLQGYRSRPMEVNLIGVLEHLPRARASAGRQSTQVLRHPAVQLRYVLVALKVAVVGVDEEIARAERQSAGFDNMRIDKTPKLANEFGFGSA